MLAGDLERAASGSGGDRPGPATPRTGAVSPKNIKHVRFCLQNPQQCDDGGGGLHGSGLVLREGARAAAQQLTGLDLRKAEIRPNGADFLGRDSRFILVHYGPLRCKR